jgi:hypothetical protein
VIDAKLKIKVEDTMLLLSINNQCSAPAGQHWSAPTTTQQKKVLILTMKLWKMKKSDFDHEIMNLVEKNVGTPAILGRTLHNPMFLGAKR